MSSETELRAACMQVRVRHVWGLVGRVDAPESYRDSRQGCCWNQVTKESCRVPKSHSQFRRPGKCNVRSNVHPVGALFATDR